MSGKNGETKLENKTNDGVDKNKNIKQTITKKRTNINKKTEN